jgi:hypothetical protein
MPNLIIQCESDISHLNGQEILMKSSRLMKKVVFWDLAPCSLGYNRRLVTIHLP